MYDELVNRLNVFRLKEDEYQSIPVYVSEIIGEAADAIELLQKTQQLKWIPVSERLPEDDTICILTNGVSNAIGYRGKVLGWHLIWTDYLVESEVTHWMPLPHPPKEENK